MKYLCRENPGVARGQGWSALSGNSIGQSCSTMFNQDWFPANNPDFGQNHNNLASNRSSNSVNNQMQSQQISTFSNSSLAGNLKVARTWTGAAVPPQNNPDFGQNHNNLASNRSVNSVNNLQISKLSNSLLAANSKVETRPWTGAAVPPQNYFNDSSSSEQTFYR